MVMQLSWDLHVHPGPSSVPRWGTGIEIQEAARRAGLKGFVWKSHEEHTARACRGLPSGPPWAIGSASLNAFADANSVAEAIADGARWVWGPTYRDGQVAWDLPLPARWSSFAGMLQAVARPLVLATGHLSAAGRRVFAEIAAASKSLRCSITHSLYLPPAEVAELRDLGCVFEVDLYTASHQIAGRPEVSLAGGIRTLRDLGATVYLTTDAGQRDTGDPYVFSKKRLDDIAGAIGADVLNEIAVANPDAVAQRVLGPFLS